MPPNNPWPSWYDDAIYGLGSVHLLVGILMMLVEFLETPIRSLSDLKKGGVRGTVAPRPLL